jgi:hypothetical protein
MFEYKITDRARKMIFCKECASHLSFFRFVKVLPFENIKINSDV